MKGEEEYLRKEREILKLLQEMKVFSPLTQIIEKALEFDRELKEIDEKEREINDEIAKLSPRKGTLVYKWVKNKVGKKYWYWYLHVRENGKTRSIYLGSTIPPEIAQGIEDRRRLHALSAKLKMLEKRKEEILEKISIATQVLISA